MKTCNKCLTEKSLEEFPKRSAMCRPCHNAYTRAHYQANKQYYVKKARKNNEAVRELVRKEKEKPCVDCGIQYPYYVMDFDHLGDKEFDISVHMSRYGFTKIKQEIEKCDVVCSNCHRARTHNRMVAVGLPKNTHNVLG